MKSSSFNYIHSKHSVLGIIRNLQKSTFINILGGLVKKNSGNIIRVTDIFQNFKTKIRDNITPVGFIIGLKNIYLSTSNGKLLVVDIYSGKTISILKIDNNQISKPFILNKNLFLIKDNAIVKLN